MTLRTIILEKLNEFADFLELHEGKHPGFMMNVAPDIDMTTEAILTAFLDHLPKEKKDGNTVDPYDHREHYANGHNDCLSEIKDVIGEKSNE